MSSATQRVLNQLGRFESPNVTYVDPAGDWPIVWKRARGCHVWDAEGRKYLDLTAAFGVAAAGHANPAVVQAGQRQMGELLHAMGDVHPHALKAQLLQALSDLTFGRWGSATQPMQGQTLLGSSGFEAVEAALKTARLATGKSGIIAFRGGYHGLGYGALNATQRSHFREPFRNQLGEFGIFLDWPPCQGSCDDCDLPECQALEKLENDLRRIFRDHSVGAIIAEPIQARGGIRIPPPGFLPLLRRIATEQGALLILDEIYTGFGRTGRWFACEHTEVVPDLICLGKALTGGFPLSACVGRSEVMQAWPRSSGEAIHTSTFLGHPVGCAMALVQIAEIRKKRLPERSARLGRQLLQELQALPSRLGKLRLRARGLGLMAGIELSDNQGQPATAESITLVKKLLANGFIVLPEGEHGEVISFTPPLTISETDLKRTIRTLQSLLEALGTAESRKPSTRRKQP